MKVLFILAEKSVHKIHTLKIIKDMKDIKAIKYAEALTICECVSDRDNSYCTDQIFKD